MLHSENSRYKITVKNITYAKNEHVGIYAQKLCNSRRSVLNNAQHENVIWREHRGDSHTRMEGDTHNTSDNKTTMNQPDLFIMSTECSYISPVDQRLRASFLNCHSRNPENLPSLSCASKIEGIQCNRERRKALA